MATIDLSAPPKDIIVAQGATIEVPLAITRNKQPYDLTGFTLRMQVRKNFSSTQVLINATTQNGKLVWQDQAGGTFKLLLAESDTATAGNPLIVFPKDTDVLDCVFDIEVVSLDGFVYKVARGSFSVEREVTRV